MLKPEHLFLAVKPVDMRRGIDTLTQYVQETLNASWHEGAAFVFANKSRTRLKAQCVGTGTVSGSALVVFIKVTSSGPERMTWHGR